MVGSSSSTPIASCNASSFLAHPGRFPAARRLSIVQRLLSTDPKCYLLGKAIHHFLLVGNSHLPPSPSGAGSSDTASSDTTEPSSSSRRNARAILHLRWLLFVPTHLTLPLYPVFIPMAYPGSIISLLPPDLARRFQSSQVLQIFTIFLNFGLPSAWKA